MKKKTLLIMIFMALAVLFGVLVFFLRGGSLSNPDLKSLVIKGTIKPSETFIDYADPAGFSFSYSDNLSITKNETEDPNSYADLQLYSKDVSGSINLKIVDTKLKTLEDWLKESKIASSSAVEKKLGEMKAFEAKTPDRLMLGALDQGVLFTIEVPLIEQDFWMKVYDRLLSDFTFVSPSADTAQGGSVSSSEDVTFEAEEVVE